MHHIQYTLPWYRLFDMRYPFLLSQIRCVVRRPDRTASPPAQKTIRNYHKTNEGAGHVLLGLLDR
jgi:hypothetical protein